MKNLNSSILIIIVVALSSFSSGCKGNTDNQHNHGNMEHSSHENMDENQGENKSMQADMPDILSSYLEIKKGLVEDNPEAVKQAANKMMEVKEVSGAMKSNLETISKAGDLKQQRNSFSELSNHMYKMVKSGELEGMALYWKHCPMARENKGANWLSVNEEISNPYMGQKMLKCGSVQETI